MTEFPRRALGRIRARPTTLAMVGALLLGACSLRDLSRLQKGSGSLAGGGAGAGNDSSGGASGDSSSGHSGAPGSGGDLADAGQGGEAGKQGGEAGTDTDPNGGSSGVGGDQTDGRGGSSTGATAGTAQTAGSGGATGGSGPATGGTGGAATGTGGAAQSKPTGPWTFDTLGQATVDWKSGRKNVVIDWVQEGEVEPKGAMLVDTTRIPSGEANHALEPPVDLSDAVFTVRLRTASGQVDVSLYADHQYILASSPSFPIGEDWVTLSWPFAEPFTSGAGYTPAEIRAIGITVNGSSGVWVDEVRLERPDASEGGAGGAGALVAGAGGGR